MCCDYQTRHNNLSELNISGRTSNKDVPEYVVNLMVGEVCSQNVIK